jgi:hypothetical protein
MTLILSLILTSVVSLVLGGVIVAAFLCADETLRHRDELF